MTMRAREQDIRRDKAASNICTNQALLALAASIYLATIGPHGLRDVAALGAARAAELEAGPRGRRRAAAPPRPVPQRVRRPGPRRAGPSIGDCSTTASSPAWCSPTRSPTTRRLADGLLVCATEVTTSAEIARFAEALGDVLRGARPSASRRAPARGGGPR